MEYIGIIVLIVSFLFLLIVGVPIAFSIGIAGILTMLVSIDAAPAFATFAQRMATGLDSFALLAIPFFILAGNIMNSGGIAIRLINLARVLVGRYLQDWHLSMYLPTCCLVLYLVLRLLRLPLLEPLWDLK